MNIAKELQEKSVEEVLLKAVRKENNYLKKYYCLEYLCDHCPEKETCDILDLVFMLYDKHSELQKND